MSFVRCTRTKFISVLGSIRVGVYRLPLDLFLYIYYESTKSSVYTNVCGYDSYENSLSIPRSTEMKYADTLIQYVVTEALQTEDPLPQKHTFFIRKYLSDTPTLKYIKLLAETRSRTGFG